MIEIHEICCEYCLRESLKDHVGWIARSFEYTDGDKIVEVKEQCWSLVVKAEEDCVLVCPFRVDVSKGLVYFGNIERVSYGDIEDYSFVVYKNVDNVIEELNPIEQGLEGHSEGALSAILASEVKNGSNLVSTTARILLKKWIELVSDGASDARKSEFCMAAAGTLDAVYEADKTT